MKNNLIILGLIGIGGSALGQTAPKSTEIVQQGEKNVIKMEVKGSEKDTTTRTTIVTQNGTNQLRIDAKMPADSLRKALENIDITQEGKSNKVSIQTESTTGNSVKIQQSGSNNKVTIVQKSGNE
ncbi:hypothetical protein [Arundinibacter roseus]|uniref:Uncharacterized protein n=1 Tax=Arundinibacter roseus TaxID=2070510 RepID=A0A4R4KBJ8_9BACT|nr:hypothetical protein [Arundinibacter roseus]TDB64056.1 hypothetical protein EZE20_14025 [Arundinibacter roseus]